MSKGTAVVNCDKECSCGGKCISSPLRNRLAELFVNCGGKGGKPGPCPGAKKAAKANPATPSPTSKAKGFGSVKTAAGKVAKVEALLAAAKGRVAAIASQLKDAKVNLKAVAAEVKKNVDQAAKWKATKDRLKPPPKVKIPAEKTVAYTPPELPHPGDGDYPDVHGFIEPNWDEWKDEEEPAKARKGAAV